MSDARIKAYVVGGAVRDGLLGLPVTDRDWVVVGATPETLAALGYRPVGRDFPVFLHPQTHEEYALARTERKSGRGYRGFTLYSAPDVTLEQDLARRDLTVNAMAMDEAGALIDPFGGARDLKDGVLRHVSEAFAEDPVRLLRVARFAARFRFRIADETLALMRRMVEAGEADHLVPERVWQEFARGLEAAYPGEMLLALVRCGALAKLMPELAAEFEGGARANLLEALERGAQSGTPVTVRFALLSWFAGASATAKIDRLCERLRVPAEVRELAVLALRLQDGLRSAGQAGPESLLSLLKTADAFRRGARFAELLAVFRLAEPGETTQAAVQRLARALAAAAAIDAGAVARTAGSPAQIAAAIEAARLAALRAALGGGNGGT